MRLPCRNPGSSLHRELPLLTVVRSLEREADCKLADSRIAVDADHVIAEKMRQHRFRRKG